MGFDVTSWFIDQTRLQSSQPKRVFTIGTSDYSDRVEKWPTIKYRWDDPRPKNFTAKLLNQDQELNVFLENPTLMRDIAEIKFGFTHPTSGDELITVLSGTIRRVSFARGSIAIDVTNKFDQLSQRGMGDNDASVVFSGGTFHPSDIFWAAATSYGGLSSIESSSNPDIDYDAFVEWDQYFVDNSIFMDGLFSGQKCVDVMRRLSRHTESAIFISGSRVSVSRFSLENSNITSLDNRDVEDTKVELKDSDIFNTQKVFAGYNPSSDTYSVQTTDISSTSVSSFGARETILKDDRIWYVNSVSALDMAQRLNFARGEPSPEITINSFLQLLTRQVGETISYVDSFFNIADNYRIMEQSINTNDGTSTVKISRAQLLGLFRLDVSTLDSTKEVLS